MCLFSIDSRKCSDPVIGLRKCSDPCELARHCLSQEAGEKYAKVKVGTWFDPASSLGGQVSRPVNRNPMYLNGPEDFGELVY